MSKSEILVVGIILIMLAVFLQLTPVILGHNLVLLTTLSALPIYIIARRNPRLGILSYILTSILIALFSKHESIFFLLSSGIIGTCLGLGDYYEKKPADTILVVGIILTITLSFINYVMDIPVFGTEIPGAMSVQILIMLAFAIVFSYVWLYISRQIYVAFQKIYK